MERNTQFLCATQYTPSISAQANQKSWLPKSGTLVVVNKSSYIKDDVYCVQRISVDNFINPMFILHKDAMKSCQQAGFLLRNEMCTIQQQGSQSRLVHKPSVLPYTLSPQWTKTGRKSRITSTVGKIRPPVDNFTTEIRPCSLNAGHQQDEIYTAPLF